MSVGRVTSQGEQRLAVYRTTFRLVRVVSYALGTTARIAGALILAAFCILLLNYVVLSTDKAHAYRKLDPSLAECPGGLAEGWTVLADTGREALWAAIPSGGDVWVDASNDESAAIATDARWAIP